MTTIIHRIRLKPGIRSDAFERWVKEADYAACPELPSLESFEVYRVSLDPGAAFHYIEVIRVRSEGAFERDMRTVTFAALVRRFDQMAEVVDEARGELIEPGFARGSRPS